MDILLIIVLIILAGFGLHGYLRGLVRVLFSLLAVFLTIGLATALAPVTFQFLKEQTPIYGVIKEKSIDFFQGNASEQVQGEQKGLAQEDTFLGIELPEELRQFFSGQAKDQANTYLEESGVYDKLGEFFADQILQRLAWIISFTAIFILLSVLVHILDLVAKLPVLKNLNRFGGLLIGLLQGLIAVWILFLLVSLCQGSQFGREMTEEIQQNEFLKLLSDFNMIEHFINGIR